MSRVMRAARALPAARTSASMLAVYGACAAASLARRSRCPPPPEGAPTTPALTRLLAEREVESVADGYAYAEGPLWHPDGYLLFADSPRDRLHKWDPATGDGHHLPRAQRRGHSARIRPSRAACSRPSTRTGVSRGPSRDGSIVTRRGSLRGQAPEQPKRLRRRALTGRCSSPTRPTACRGRWKGRSWLSRASTGSTRMAACACSCVTWCGRTASACRRTGARST